jgi:mannose-6-phosphate isomerase-like protein (cupin superfamily)
VRMAAHRTNGFADGKQYEYKIFIRVQLNQSLRVAIHDIVSENGHGGRSGNGGFREAVAGGARQAVHDPMRFGALTLYQIGDLSCTGGYEIGDHVQFCYEISYIAAGKGVFTCDDAVFEVQEGDLVLHRPGQWHNGIADETDPFRYFYIAFNVEAQTEAAGFSMCWDSRRRR